MLPNHRRDTTQDLICILSPEVLPIEILAKIARSLSLADISRLLRTDKAFSRLAERKDFIDLLRFMLNHEQVIIPVKKSDVAPTTKADQSDDVMEALKQLDSLSEEKRPSVTMKRIFQKVSLDNLDSAIDQADRVSHQDRLSDDISKKLAYFLIVVFFFGVSGGTPLAIFIAVFNEMSISHGFFLWLGIVGGLSGLGILPYTIATLRQHFLLSKKNELAQQFGDDQQIDVTIPLLQVSVSHNSHTEPKPLTSPMIEEITDDLDEVLTVDTKDYPLTRKGSMGQFARKMVVNEEFYSEEIERKDSKEYR